MSADDDMSPRWAAVMRIQREWRRAIAHNKMRRLIEAARAEQAQTFADADQLEAALLIQNRMRMCLAKKSVAAKRLEVAAAGGPASSQVKAAEVEYVHPSKLDPSAFIFRGKPPTDDEVLDLFDAIDITNSGVIPRGHARAVFDRLLMDLYPGDSKAAFDSAVPVDDDMITPSALYFVVLRAMAL